MVSLRFTGHKPITDSSLFSHCVLNCRKVEKLEIEETKIDMLFVNKIHKSFEDPISKRFLDRVKTLILNNITFGGNNELERNVSLGKFCQALIRFTSLETLEFVNVEQFHKIAKFFINTENEI